MATRPQPTTNAEEYGLRYIDIATTFAKTAKRRTRTHCKFITHIASLFIDRLSRPPPGYELNATEVGKACFFIESLPHVKGARFSGRKIELLPWQVFHFANIFGWTAITPDGTRGPRLHSIAFTQVAKKNGKSTMAAPVGLYMISPLEGELGADVFCAASKRDQASIVLNVARSMLRVDKTGLLNTFNFSVWANHIEREDPDGNISRMGCLSSDTPQTDDGINPSCVIMDEIHAMVDSELRGTLIKGTVARDNPLIYEISTAGELRDNSPCVEENRKAHAWARGDIDLPHFFPMVFEQDDPLQELNKPASWLKSNPSLGFTLHLPKLIQIRADAAGNPLLENQYMSKHLNCFMGAAEAWLSMDVWHDAQTELHSKPDDLPLYLGFDLSSVSDLTAIGYVWFDDRGDDPPHYWVGADSFATQIACNSNRLIKQYSQQGFIQIIGQFSIEHSYIRDHIRAIGETEAIVEIGFDPWNAAALAERLGTIYDMVEVRQGPITMSAPMKQFEAALRSGRIHVLGSPALTWQASNLVAKVDRNDNWAPDKKMRQNKVDAIVAILIAFARAWRQSPDEDWINPDDVLLA